MTVSNPLHQQDDNDSHGLEVRPIGGRIGAEIAGVRLSGSLAPDTVGAINAALLKHKVIIFRGQTHLDDAGQEAFGRLLGQLVPHPTVPSLAGTEAVLELDGAEGARASSWHTDVTFRDAYPKISILRSVTAPERGGDTVWSNTAAAYAELPEALRDFADKLWALHSNEYDYVGDRKPTPEQQRRYQEVFTSTLYETEHPVVHVHPETGERSLIIGHFVKRLIGFTTSDSQRLLSLFLDHATRPENTFRLHWAQGDVAIWDNRATLHRAVDDYDDLPRIVRRVTLAGEAPISVDGRRSATRVVGKKPGLAA
jgi:alpha-ketoglutarate-dependent sulfate ester dioxygenase